MAIIDELGRGTSTFDGYSIANSVLRYLIRNIRCRTLFATHYHMLLDDFRGVSGIASYHMSCKINSDHREKIQLLYKFCKGECPKSFGMNVAIKSGIDLKLVDYAALISQNLMLKMKEMNKISKLPPLREATE